jgi:EmrB/QacA subfamily drug resistance transporter
MSPTTILRPPDWTARRNERPDNPWRALWAMMVGFFMILVDSTIVAVANPRIMEKLNTDYNAVIWVTSAYLLAYAVPLLVAGRLGDRFGPKNLYLLGLSVFSAASLWCGLAGSIEMLIAARVVQGLGAALLTPQTLSTITRIFPPERRGVAMSVWGATAGIATLVGPLAGGVLVDRLGWQWIFFVNVPIGVVGLALAVWLIPVLPTQRHRFDLLGVLLSGIAMFLLVFGLQEGQSHDWSPWIWAMIAGGVGVMALFVYWQSINKHEPLIPLQLFTDRDFSLSNVGVSVIGFVVTPMVLPVMFYAQVVCGLSPTRSALLTAPMAVATGMLARVVGTIVDRYPPRPIVGFGFSVLAVSLTWLSVEMTPTTAIWRLVLPFIGMGVGMAFIWSPLAATATRNLPPRLAGAGSGVYNATRQVGAVLGSASMAAFMTARISAEMPPMPADMPRSPGAFTQLPDFLHAPFAAAMSQSMLLPAFVALFGVVAALFLGGSPQRSRAAVDDDGYDFDDDELDNYDPRTEVLPRISEEDQLALDDYGDYLDDDDNYVEYTVSAPEPVPAEFDPQVHSPPRADDGDTEPLATRADPNRGGPVESWSNKAVEMLHNEPPESWLRETDDPPAGLRRSSVEPIGFAHNGFHVDREQRFQKFPAQPPSLDDDDSVGTHAADRGSGGGSSGAHRRPQQGRHHVDSDPETYGRHSMPSRD